MLRVKLNGRSNYRKYSTQAVTKAYESVQAGHYSIKAASRHFEVPYSTLRDRIRGKIKPACCKSGPESLLNSEEEANLVKHIQLISSLGYGYTRSEVTALATDLAIYLGKKSKEDKPLSLQWFYNFMQRWPDLKVQKPRALEVMRAKATSEETVRNYFDELESIMEKYQLQDRPECIFNVDEKGIMQNHKPPHVVSSSNEVPVAVTTPRSSTTTVIGCGSALGVAIPPYFVFKGKRMRDELMNGCSPGAAGTVSDSGWSNSDIFKKYLETHFIKYCQTSSDNPVLVLYDGHASHISLSLINWARDKNIILFVLPAHTSHVLQPMDVGCFGPFERIYNGLRHKFMRDNITSGIDRYSVCEVACKAYCLALTPSNLQSSFRKSGIYPINRNVINPNLFLPSTMFHSANKSDNLIDISSQSPTRNSPIRNCYSFFKGVEETIIKECKQTKKRKVLSAVVGGKAITEDSTLEKIEKFHRSKKSKQREASTSKELDSHGNKLSIARPQTTRSAIPLSNPTEDSESDDPVDESDLCCKCKQWQPEAVKKCVSLIFVKWAQCTYQDCQHWTHLQYCTPTTVVRRNADFFCPCHDCVEE